MAKAKGDRVVVLHSVISHGGKAWEKGTVLDRDELKFTPMSAEGKATGPEQDAYERLCGLGAVRPASSEEAGLDKVDVSGVPLALSPLAQAELQAKDEKIAWLTQQAGALQDRVNAAAALAPAAAPPPPPSAADKAAIAAMTSEKDTAIQALEERIKALEAQAAGQQKAAAAPPHVTVAPPASSRK